MKVHPGEQGTPEWDDLRRGKITASVAQKMITEKGAISVQAKPFIGRLLAEELGLQEPEPIKPSYWMERGVEVEPQARGFFAVETGLHVETCAFIESDDGLSGFSPDGFVWDKKVLIPLEIKCPSAAVHIGYLLDGVLPYKQQCHFAMVISLAPYMHFMSYHPDLKPFILKVGWDEYTIKVSNALDDFKAKMVVAKSLVEEL